MTGWALVLVVFGVLALYVAGVVALVRWVGGFLRPPGPREIQALERALEASRAPGRGCPLCGGPLELLEGNGWLSWVICARARHFIRGERRIKGVDRVH